MRRPASREVHESAGENEQRRGFIASGMKPDTLVIVNPASGGGRALHAEPEVASLLASRGCRTKFVHSKSSEDIRELAARAEAQGFRIVVALGGDGAFHHLVEGVHGRDVVAGFFPAGNGNDIARSLRALLARGYLPSFSNVRTSRDIRATRASSPLPARHAALALGPMRDSLSPMCRISFQRQYRPAGARFLQRFHGLL